MKSFMVCCRAKEVGNKLIEILREKLILSIEQNGIGSIKTINLSQELDKLIVAEMSK